MRKVIQTLFDEKDGFPIFVLEDNSRRIPKHAATGSCWFTSWDKPDSKYKRLVFLNTSILTTEGTFDLEKVTLDKVKELLEENASIEKLSAIGHQSTAETLSELLDCDIAVNRILYEQEEGDLAIVFKLKGRPEEGKTLSKEDLESIGYDFYLLHKV